MIMTSLTYLLILLLITLFYLFISGKRATNDLKNKFAKQKKDFEFEIQYLTDSNQIKNHLFGVLVHDLSEVNSAFAHIGKKVNFLVKKERIQEIQKLGEQLNQKGLYATALTKRLRFLLEPSHDTSGTIISNLDKMLSQKLKSSPETNIEAADTDLKGFAKSLLPDKKIFQKT